MGESRGPHGKGSVAVQFCSAALSEWLWLRMQVFWHHPDVSLSWRKLVSLPLFVLFLVGMQLGCLCRGTGSEEPENLSQGVRDFHRRQEVKEKLASEKLFFILHNSLSRVFLRNCQFLFRRWKVNAWIDWPPKYWEYVSNLQTGQLLPLRVALANLWGAESNLYTG